MLIDLSQLESEGAQVDEEFAGADLIVEARRAGVSAVRPKSGRLKARIRPEGGLARATGNVEIQAEAYCDRCLKSLELLMTGEFDQRYAWSQLHQRASNGTANEETSILEQDLDIAELESPFFDTRELAREQTELLTPIHVLCAESCAGLCSVCGVDLNTTSCDCAQEV